MANNRLHAKHCGTFRSVVRVESRLKSNSRRGGAPKRTGPFVSSSYELTYLEVRSLANGSVFGSAAVAVGWIGPRGDWMMPAVLGSGASSNALRALGTRQASGLSRRFCSGATRSSTAETRLFRDWFLVAVATVAVRHGVLKTIRQSLLYNRYCNWSPEQICTIDAISIFSTYHPSENKLHCIKNVATYRTQSALILY